MSIRDQLLGSTPINACQGAYSVSDLWASPESDPDDAPFSQVDLFNFRRQRSVRWRMPIPFSGFANGVADYLRTAIFLLLELSQIEKTEKGRNAAPLLSRVP